MWKDYVDENSITTMWPVIGCLVIVVVAPATWWTLTAGKRARNMSTCTTEGRICFSVSTDRTGCFVLLWVVLLICPSSMRSHPPEAKDVCEYLGALDHSVLLPYKFSLWFMLSSLHWLAQDLAPSHSCSVDRSISDMPTSTPMMIDVSESLLSGGWRSPEEGDKEVNHSLTLRHYLRQVSNKSHVRKILIVA